MLKLKSIPNGVKSTIITMSYYATYADDKIATQHIYYDHPEEFSANLNVLACPDHLNSLHFEYHPKNGVGTTLLFNILNLGNGRLKFFCSNNRDNAIIYDVSNCLDKITTLNNHILNINFKWPNASKYLNDLDQITQTKELLKSFANIVRSILRADVHNDSALNMICSTFKLEEAKIQNILEIETPNQSKNKI